jgi:hypothetical protein
VADLILVRSDDRIQDSRNSCRITASSLRPSFAIRIGRPTIPWCSLVAIAHAKEEHTTLHSAFDILEGPRSHGSAVECGLRLDSFRTARMKRSNQAIQLTATALRTQLTVDS